MTRTQETALAAGALTIGVALPARELRAARGIDFRGEVRGDYPRAASGS